MKKPTKFTTYLCFDYKEAEDVEVKVEFSITGDSEDGYELNLTIIENNTEFTTEELESYIYNSDELFEKLQDKKADLIQEYIEGYEDYLIAQEEEKFKEGR